MIEETSSARKKKKERRDHPRGPFSKGSQTSRRSRRYLGQGGLTAQKSGLERARRIDGMLPGEGHVRRCRGALAEPRQGDLSARLLGDRRRFPGRWRHDKKGLDPPALRSARGYSLQTREYDRGVQEGRNDVVAVDSALSFTGHILEWATTRGASAIADGTLPALVYIYFF